jgi:hypothetical protein
LKWYFTATCMWHVPENALMYLSNPPANSVRTCSIHKQFSWNIYDLRFTRHWRLFSFIMWSSVSWHCIVWWVGTILPLLWRNILLPFSR